MQEGRYPGEEDLRFARVQDIRASWYFVYYWSLHELCYRHVAALGQTPGSLDQEGRGSSVSAGWLNNNNNKNNIKLHCLIAKKKNQSTVFYIGFSEL